MSTIEKIICGAAVLALIGCGRNSFTWREEVQLKSGEVISVKRTAKTKQLGEIGGGGWESEGMTVEVVDGKSSEMPAKWSSKLLPVILDKREKTGEWFVVATVVTCQDWKDIGRPQLPYAEFKYRNGVWVAQSLSAELIGREANLLTDIDSDGEPDHTLQTKRHVAARAVGEAEWQKKIVSNWIHYC